MIFQSKKCVLAFIVLQEAGTSESKKDGKKKLKRKI